MTNSTIDLPDELRHRISMDLAHFQGELPEPYSIAWRGYLAALLEWGLLDIAPYNKLLALLPAVLNDPAAEILRGRE
jgi:hypothetical protein